MNARTPRPVVLTSPLRRRFLKAAAASGLLAAVERNVALAQGAPDYKALVCINLFGGNDGENTLIRFDAAGYNHYASVRPTASGINIAQSSLLPIQPISVATPFGFNPACGPLQSLFNQKKLAVVANMGMLAQPSTKAALGTAAAPRPANLFSHSDQSDQSQSGDYVGIVRTGWGGRIADRLDAANPGSVFPPLVSVHGLRTFTAGRSSVPLTVPENAYFKLSSSAPDPNQFQYDALRDAAVAEILAQSRSNVYDIAAQIYSEEGLSASSVVVPLLFNSSSVVTPLFAQLGSSIARQLKSVALLIEGREQTRMKRQVFFVEDSAYDTHGGQVPVQGGLLQGLSSGIEAFLDAMSALGLSDKVTVFTLSEFGRAFKPSANGGTDHGWGNYAFVAGGAVKGGDFYGTLPNQAVNGPDDFGNAGRWIPTTSLEQYGATLCRWFGIAEGDLPYVFPNIGAFGNTNMGFMA